MKTLILLVVIAGLGAAVYWYFADSQHRQQIEHAQIWLSQKLTS